jgi:hypothetical protein
MNEWQQLQQAIEQATAKIDETERGTEEFDAAHKEADDLRQRLHDLQQACPHSSYRQSPGWPDRETQAIGPTVVTCLLCGMVEVFPAPELEVEIAVQVEVNAKVDLVRYFERLTPAQQKHYMEVELDDNYGGEEWERPMAFLSSDVENDLGIVDVVPFRPFPERGSRAPQIVRQTVDVDQEPERVTIREGKVAYGRGWTEDDFNSLRARVAWLDKAHAALEEQDEDLARRPGPNDVPLSFREG